MPKKTLWTVCLWTVLLLFVVSSCSAPAAPAASSSGAASESAGNSHEQPVPNPADQTTDPSGEEIVVPEIAEGKFNVAFVYVGPISDGGWTDAHNQGREYVAEQLADSVHTVYLESVPEDADAERVIRALASKGFNAIFTTSFGYMDATATVAAEFPDLYFVHISGFRKNETNFANLFGAMESMKYLAGIIAGGRAKADGSNRIGYIAPFPTPEVIRQANATALGMRKTCPDCLMDIRWIFTWFDPSTEREAAQSLIEAGASVVLTGADTSSPVQVAADNNRYGIGNDSDKGCSLAPDHCLTAPYWQWGPIYLELIKAMQAGTWQPGDLYLDVDSGSLGLLGFEEGADPQPGVPADVVPQVRELLDQMRAGAFTRFDLFAGPIKDNHGNVVVPAGEKLTQSDLEGIDDALAAELGRPACTYCMDWLAEGIVPEAEIPQ